MVRFGIIGCGNMGKNHARSFWNGEIVGGVLTAICDTDETVTAWLKAQAHDVLFYNSAEKMLASGEVDAIIISTPHYDHPDLSRDAIKKGIHVMCEKPIGVYTKNVRQLNEVAKAHDVVFGIMYNQRTNPLYMKMREMVQGGVIGELKRTSWLITDWYRPQAYYDNGGWRATWKGEGGGVLINQCPHNLDLWQWICGMPVKIHAFAHNGKWHDIEVEDDVTAYVEYENGATGIFVTSTADAPGTNRFEILGDRGKLVCEDNTLIHYELEMSERTFNETNKEMFAWPKATKHIVDCNDLSDAKFLPAGAPAGGTQHVGVINAFIEKINGTGELIADGIEGIDGLTISNGIHLSAWLNQTITLPLDEDLFLAELEKRY